MFFPVKIILFLCLALGARVYLYDAGYDDNALGCYKDKQAKDRIFKKKYVSLVGRTIADCDTECKNDGAAYFGKQTF